MKSFSTFLIEKRRNPEQNPKVGLYDVLEKYKDDDDVYITFVSDVGASSHKEVTKKTKEGKPDEGKKTALDSAIGSALGKLDNKHLQKERLKNVLPRNASGFKVGINPKSRYNTPNGIYTYPVKKAMLRYGDKKTRKLNVPFAGNQPAVYFLKPKGKIVDLNNYGSNQYIDDKSKLIHMLNKWAKVNRKNFTYEREIEGLAYYAIKSARIETYGGRFWNFTRCAAEYMMNNVEFSETYAVTKVPEYADKSKNIKFTTLWNKVFRDLGYVGAVDKQEEGIIHPAEPMQAVFFDMKQMKVIDFSYNKTYAKKDQDKDGIQWIDHTYDKDAMNKVVNNFYWFHNAMGETDLSGTKFSMLVFYFFREFCNHTGLKKLHIKIEGDSKELLQMSPDNSQKNNKNYWKQLEDKDIDTIEIYDLPYKDMDPIAEISIKEFAMMIPDVSDLTFKGGKKGYHATWEDVFERAKKLIPNKSKVTAAAVKAYFEDIFEKS